VREGIVCKNASVLKCSILTQIRLGLKILLEESASALNLKGRALKARSRLLKLLVGML
jgi:hypothetical protein